MVEESPSRSFAGNPRQLALIGAGTVALAIAIFAIWYLIVRTPMEAAFTGLKPADASLISDELKRQKTPYKLDDNGATIKVPSDQVNAARIAILGGDLPLKGTVGFELFSKSDMGLTEFAQKINYQRALQGELARTLMSLSNVETARVHITLPESGIFQDEHRPAKASVTVAPKLGTIVDGRTIVGIQRLVASAVDDLDAASVVVLDGAGKQLSADAPDPIPNIPSNAGSGVVEQAYAAQVRGIAAQLVNDPAMRITVWAPANAEIAAKANVPGAAESGERTFPLNITIALTAGPAPGLRERLIPLLQSTIGFDPALGDNLTLLRLAETSSYRVDTPVASATGVPSPDEWTTSRSSGAGFWSLIACALAGIAVVVLALRLRTKREMTETERGSFAARLRELLDADERLDRGEV